MTSLVSLGSVPRPTVLLPLYPTSCIFRLEYALRLEDTRERNGRFLRNTSNLCSATLDSRVVELGLVAP